MSTSEGPTFGIGTSHASKPGFGAILQSARMVLAMHGASAVRFFDLHMRDGNVPELLQNGLIGRDEPDEVLDLGRRFAFREDMLVGPDRIFPGDNSGFIRHNLVDLEHGNRLVARIAERDVRDRAWCRTDGRNDGSRTI